MSKDKKSEILHATLQLVAEHGFHGAPCSLIAELAGVAAGTIYRYFENKDVLINELYLDLSLGLISPCWKVIPRNSPLKSVLPILQPDF